MCGTRENCLTQGGRRVGGEELLLSYCVRGSEGVILCGDISYPSRDCSIDRKKVESAGFVSLRAIAGLRSGIYVGKVQFVCVGG